MDKESIDLIELSTEILSSPGDCADHALITLLELEDQNLNFLCPLARAIYLLETNRAQRVDAKEALDTCFVIDDSLSRSCLISRDECRDGSVDHAGVVEEVSHVIKKHFCSKELTLGFKSTGDMLFCESFWGDYLRSVMGSEWPLSKLAKPASFNEKIFGILDSEADASPSAYPEDSGEFLGTLTYALSSVNGIAVDGPVLQHSKVERDWEGLSEQYSQRFPESAQGDDEGQMCWLHYLNAEQAKLLGIASSGKDAMGENPDYPEWVPKAVSEEELESTWISPDELQDSYSGGELSVPQSTEAWFALGCGADWSPGADLGEVDDSEDEAADRLVYDPVARPLITAKITRGDTTLPSEILTLMPYLIQLGQMLEEQQS